MQDKNKLIPDELWQKVQNMLLPPEVAEAL
jgi:hypothetical protein